MKKSLIFITTAIALLITATNAQAFEYDKQPLTNFATVTKSTLKMKTNDKKEVTLMNIKLSAQEKNDVLQHIKSRVSIDLGTSAALPSHIDLGMNHVPVLDQGQHGACVTFAATAALDAQLNKGDYISQLCNLELGSYLANNGYGPNGWEGSSGPLVLNQLQQFGYISKSKQKATSCANVFEYPLNDQENQGNPLSLNEFHKMSENEISSNGEMKWGWSPLMDSLDRFLKHFDSTDDAKKTLIDIKKALQEHNYVTIGTLIFTSENCQGITCASHVKKNDTWSLTNSIQNAPQYVGGHEMVITGYDDNAVAKDNDGVTHSGLLILRNSWGSEVGNNGNYYMTYDYFINFAMEAQKIVSIKPE